jgi:hypothetical protein
MAPCKHTKFIVVEDSIRSLAVTALISNVHVAGKVHREVHGMVHGKVHRSIWYDSNITNYP